MAATHAGRGPGIGRLVCLAMVAVTSVGCGRALFDWRDLDGGAGDARVHDAEVPDATGTDAMSTDAMSTDAMSTDATGIDAMGADAGVDADTSDANVGDATGSDAAVEDAMVMDANASDAMGTDANTSDAAPVDSAVDANTVDANASDATGTDASCGTACDCVRYVDVDATGTQDGLSWSTAFRSLQPAIDAAQTAATGLPADEVCEVWVAMGRYYTYVNAATDTIAMRPRVDIYGGFAGTETERDTRDPLTNITVLDGRNAAMTLRVYHVVTGAGPARIDGFQITEGAAVGSQPDHQGGGLYFNGLFPPTIANCEFASNAARNTAGGSGGGVMLIGNVLPAVLSNVRFVANSAGSGGGLALDNGSAIITTAEFFNNNANGTGGGIVSNASRLWIVVGRFNGNTSNNHGAGIYIDGAAADWTRIESTDFRNNATSAGGGGIGMNRAVLEVSNSTFVNNSAGNIGGAMFLNTVTSADIANVTAINNTSGGSGSGLSIGCQALPCAIRNSIFWNPSTQTELAFSGGVTFAHSIVRGGVVGDAMIDSDPLLVNPPLDLRPSSLSPAIDAADGCRAPVTDGLGIARYDVTAVSNTGIGPPADIGALEHNINGVTAPWSASACCEAASANPAGGDVFACTAAVPWTQAISYCTAAGGNVAAIHGGAEQTAITGLISTPTWIGLRSPGPGLSYAWTDGSPLDYTAWGASQPSGGADQCVALNPDGTWSDEPCATRMGVLCETP